MSLCTPLRRNSTQLDVELSCVELSCVAINGALGDPLCLSSVTEPTRYTRVQTPFEHNKNVSVQKLEARRHVKFCLSVATLN